MEVTKLSDFLKQQGLTPDGNKTVYQAFIDNWEPSRLDVWADNKGSEISAAFFGQILRRAFIFGITYLKIAKRR